MRTILLLMFLNLTLNTLCRSQSHEHEFLETYISNLGNQYRLETQASSDMDEAGDNSTKKFLAIMKNAKRSTLELEANVASLLTYSESPNGVLRKLVGITIPCYQYLIQNNKDMVEVCELMLSTENETNSNVDVGKLGSQVTDITSKHEYILETLWQAAPLLAYSILDTIPDTNGKLSSLLVTSEERKRLLSSLDSKFGNSLKTLPKGQRLGSAISIGYILRVQLAGDKKSRDKR